MQNQQLTGIKGWLLFYVLLTIFTFFTNTMGIFLETTLIFQLHIEVNAERIYDVVSYLILNILIVISLLALINKKVYAPSLIITIEVIGIIVGIVDFCLSNRDISEFIDLLIIVILGIVWILYFKHSKRVKYTYL
ncbi:DUF2569 family protein [Paenibacillus harenae]|uniref:Membrane channel-forming protein YqfA (Hemolysin III family) n=1 Tax=Paenibacillus harenae TaxID=306543 RepID=A0ABT9TZD9_PAEHA|nr:putative membrane channel-forming protein YqfA (hemolysin III family) [Paenibacillus harenae]